MRLQTSPIQIGTPRVPIAVPRVESQVAQDISVQIRDFGVKIRDWKGKQETSQKRGLRDKYNIANITVANTIFSNLYIYIYIYICIFQFRDFVSFLLLLWSIFILTTHMIYICNSMFYIITNKINY